MTSYIFSLDAIIMKCIISLNFTFLSKKGCHNLSWLSFLQKS